MGKIRLSTLGDKDAEKKQAVDAKKRRDAKKVKKGEEVTPDVTVEKTETPVIAHVDGRAGDKPTEHEADAPQEGTIQEAEAKSVRPQVRRVRVVGKNRKAATKKIDTTKEYALAEALKLLKDMSYAKFDETVELHVNLKEKGLKGEVTLPHGTGKQVRVAIADEKVLAAIEAGTFDFDILITSPAFMPKLVPFARVLGPKGLMPNPKKGTVSEKPEEAAKKFKGGTINYKSEAKAPILHQSIGKLSFKQDLLVENADILLKAIGRKNIVSVYISASMTPSVRLELGK